MTQKEYIDKAERALLHTYNRYQVVFDHGDGVYLYDLDGNGLPEFFLISDDGNEYSATLHIYEYNEYAGEAIEIITSPEFITQGQASSFMLYLTDKELIVTYTYGESYYLHHIRKRQGNQRRRRRREEDRTARDP